MECGNKTEQTKCTLQNIPPGCSGLSVECALGDTSDMLAVGFLHKCNNASGDSWKRDRHVFTLICLHQFGRIFHIYVLTDRDRRPLI